MEWRGRSETLLCPAGCPHCPSMYPSRSCQLTSTAQHNAYWFRRPHQRDDRHPFCWQTMAAASRPAQSRLSSLAETCRTQRCWAKYLPKLFTQRHLPMTPNKIKFRKVLNVVPRALSPDEAQAVFSVDPSAITLPLPRAHTELGFFLLLLNISLGSNVLASGGIILQTLQQSHTRAGQLRWLHHPQTTWHRSWVPRHLLLLSLITILIPHQVTSTVISCCLKTVTDWWI